MHPALRWRDLHKCLTDIFLDRSHEKRIDTTPEFPCIPQKVNKFIGFAWVVSIRLGRVVSCIGLQVFSFVLLNCAWRPSCAFQGESARLPDGQTFLDRIPMDNILLFSSCKTECPFPNESQCANGQPVRSSVHSQVLETHLYSIICSQMWMLILNQD